MANLIVISGDKITNLNEQEIPINIATIIEMVNPKAELAAISLF